MNGFQSGAFQPTAFQSGGAPVVQPRPYPGPAGRAKGKKRRTVVEVDGQSFEVRNAQEAHALLQAVRERTEVALKRRVQRSTVDLPAAPVVHAPVVSVRGESALTQRVQAQIDVLKEQLRKSFDEANAAYEAAMAEMDDEEVVLLLL